MSVDNSIIPIKRQRQARDKKIRRLYFVEGYSMNQIVEQEGHSKTTIFNAINSEKKNGRSIKKNNKK